MKELRLILISALFSIKINTLYKIPQHNIYMANINSYGENLSKLTSSVNTALESMAKMSQISTTDKDSVVLEYITEDNKTERMAIPSWNHLLNKVNSLSNSVQSLLSGHGIVEVQDGTKRLLRATPIPEAPAKIQDLENPGVFRTDNNWFFESLMFPKINVPIDLTNKIEASSDRVKVSRIILDESDKEAMDFYNNLESHSSIGYNQLKSILNGNGISYYEDSEDVMLPLTYEPYTGTFNVIDVKIISGKEWFYLDNMNYAPMSMDGSKGSNMTLSVKDVIKYEQTLFEVVELVNADSRIRIKPVLGINTPSVDATFKFYNEPFQKKEVLVGIGYNEINFIYIKAVNENYNLLSSEWSNPVIIRTNSLLFENNSKMSFGEFYLKYVSDFGSDWVAQAKEKKYYAYNGIIPNTPKISSDNFSVVQINTQLNSALDSADVKSTASNIENIKSKISSIKETIASQKSDLQATIDQRHVNNIQSQIKANTDQLNQLQVEYRTNLKYLQDLAYSNGAVNVSPKYRIRGFFPIPDSKFVDEVNRIGEQQIIGFNISYRYLKLDNTGTELKTFKYDIDGVEYSGVYTDWNYVPPIYLERVYDENEGHYVWKNESISNGSTVKINQVDIPIQKGEKVEIRVQSISEAGFPENPLKSPWSTSTIVEFPSNLSSSNQILNLLEDSKNESVNLALGETLSSLGVYSHLEDGIPNPNSISGSFYRHIGSSISYDYKSSKGEVHTIPMSNIISAILLTLAPEEILNVEDLLKQQGYLKR